MIGDKVRLRFQKSGDLRLLSHHDLMRCVERMMRRAEIPFKMTEGFHPSPRIVYGLSLPLGVAGINEVLEVELTEPLDAEAVRQRLDACSPNGLRFHAATVIAMRQTAEPRRAIYTFPIPEDRIAETAERCSQLLNLDHVWVARVRPKPRKLNIRPFIRSLTVLAPLSPGGEGLGVRGKAPSHSQEVSDSVGSLPPHPQPLSPRGEGSKRRSPLTPNPSPYSEEGGKKPPYPNPLPQGRGSIGELRLDLWVTNSGAARADELIRLLDLTDVLDAGAVLTRSELKLHDEEPNTDDDRPPEGKPESIPLTHADAIAAVGETDTSNPGPAPQESVTE